MTTTAAAPAALDVSATLASSLNAERCGTLQPAADAAAAAGAALSDRTFLLLDVSSDWHCLNV